MIKYNSAMDKIEVSAQMEERILDSIAARITVEKREKIHVSRNRIKVLSSVAACLIVAIAVFAIFSSTNGERPASPDVTYVNPVVTVDSIDALKELLPFTPLLPTVLQGEYEVEGMSIIAGSIAQVTYTNQVDDITYRSALGAEDVSGDYTVYEDSYVERIGGPDVTFKGNNGKISLATWTFDGCSYALSFSVGVTKEAVIDIINVME